MIAELYGADDRCWPYELARRQFLMMIMIKAKVVSRITSWKMRRDYLKSIVRLATIIDDNDAHTRGHSSKVMRYSLLISHELGLPTREMKIIKTAGILHDIGKIAIDLTTLRKITKLDEEDWAKIRMHPDMGARIAGQSGFLNEAVPIIKHHHARYAGGGYPDPVIRDHNIPIGSRIIAVADAFDAMTSHRPYRRAMSMEMAFHELEKCAGGQFDPDIVNAFLRSAA